MTAAILRKYKSRDFPAAWHAGYTEPDKAKVKRILDWLNRGADEPHGMRTLSSLCRQAALNTSTVHAILNGTYVSPPGKFLELLIDTIKREETREREGVVQIPFVETSVFKMVERVCKRAHLYRDFGLLCGYVGTGKTIALREYVARTPSAMLVQASTDMTPVVLLDKLVALTGADVRKRNRYSGGTKADKLEAVIAALSGTDKLLIFDEAETVQASCLNHLRRISDIAGVGVVLIGTEHLEPLVQDEHGRFGQISSRIGFWPPVIKHITEDDAYLIAGAAYNDDELEPKVLDAFWQCCGGSARVLSKLIPAVQNFCRKKKADLTAELVFDCYAKTMRPLRVKAIGGAK